MARTVIVVHPGAQHSRELVTALHAAGMLSRYFTSVGSNVATASLLPRALRNAISARRIASVPDKLVESFPYPEVLTRLIGPYLGVEFSQRLLYAGLDMFDRHAARGVASGSPRIVVGVESSCRHSFLAGKSVGALCVLDAASVHYRAQVGSDAGISKNFWEKIEAHKQEEIALADHIVVLSNYARETYLAAGVAAESISVVAPGVRLPKTLPERSEPPVGTPVRFLFVGNVKYAKGIDLLLDAFARLGDSEARLTIAGPMLEPGILPRVLPRGVEYLGKLDRDSAFQAYASADIVVSPSRFDGFGFVVAEAMSSGVPVIVSTATGAKDFVEHGRSGWIFTSGDASALRDTMVQAIARKAELSEMGVHARGAAGRLTWTAYGGNIEQLYSALLARICEAR